MNDCSTPVQTSSNNSKRDLSSPFDPNDVKKCRSDSDTSLEETSTSPVSQITLRDEDLLKIGNIISHNFQDQIKTIVTDAIESVVHKINNRLDYLENENKTLKSRVSDLEAKLDDANEAQDKANQYSRRNCLRISGLKESSQEDTDAIILDVAKTIGAEITLGDIDRSHRLGRPSNTQKNGKPRDIIVKFTSYRSRAKMFKQKSKLRVSKFKGTFINEELTHTRSAIYFECRRLAREHHIINTWTSDGTIIVKSKEDTTHRIETMRQLENFKRNIDIHS